MPFNIDLLKRYLGSYYWHIALFIALVYLIFSIIDKFILHFAKNVFLQDDLLGMEFLVFPLILAIVIIIIGATFRNTQIKETNTHNYIKDLSEQFFLAFENLNVGMVILDIEGNILNCNNSVLKMLGYEREEFVHHNHIEFQDEEAFKYSIEKFKQLINKEISFVDFENTILTKEGKNIWVNTTGTSIKDDKGNIKYVIANFEFIDEKKRTQIALEESEKKYTALMQDIGIGVGIINLEGTLIDCNRSLEKILGRTKEELSLLKLGEISYPEDKERYINTFMDLALGKKDFARLEKRFYKKDDSLIWTYLTGSLIRDKEGNPQCIIGMVEDITDKIEDQKAIDEYKEEIQAIYDKMSDGILIVDLQNKNFINYNDVFCEIFGYTRNEVKNITWYDLHPQEYIQHCEEIFAGIITQPRGFAPELPAIKKNGEIFYIDISTSIFNYKGQKVLLGFIRDVTERKKITETLSAYTEELQAIYEGLADGVLIIDCETREFLKVNPVFCDMLGYSEEELLKMTFYDMHPKDYLEEINKIFIKHTMSNIALTSEIACLNKNGHIFFCDVKTRLINYKSRNAMVTFFRDVTERRQAEQLLKDSQARYKAIVDGFEGYVCIVSSDSIITFMNDNLINKLGSNLTGKKCYEVLWGFEKACEGCKQNEILEGKTAKEEIYNPVDNRWYYAVHAPIVHADTKTSILLMLRDITELKQTQSELESERANLELTVNERTQKLQESLKKLEIANLKLIEVSHHKTKFLSTMSHEFRTPLNAILGFADLLNGQFFGELNTKQLEYVDLINTSGKHLLELINDLLDISKIDAGAMELQLETFYIDEFLDEIVKLLSNQFKTKNLTVSLQINHEKLNIIADKRKCNQIMLNLLSNAYKFSPPGASIDIASYKEDHKLLIKVKDKGIGIDEEQISKLFSEFYQVDRVRDAALGGTGIGLALTKRLVELQGGEIGVRSKVNEGSIFWFTLPLKDTALMPHSNALVSNIDEQPIPRNKRILVVEDNDVNIALILDQLRIYDHNVAVAKNGKESLDLIYSHKPELIFMDMIMPLMDGIEATKQIRTIAEFEKIPIIAMTASAGFEARQRHMQAGCNEQLEKPLDSKELRQILIKYLSK